jgi:lysophospholipase L1-like esterase
VIRPGAGAEKIVNSSVEDLQNLHQHDVIFLNAGANDIFKNNKRVALTQIIKFIQRNHVTNIIILDIPHRYDLSLSSCVNSEIEEFNVVSL